MYQQIAKSIGIIFRSRFFLSFTTKLSLYNTLIYPYIVYYNSAWSSTYVSSLKRIDFLIFSSMIFDTSKDAKKTTQKMW